MTIKLDPSRFIAQSYFEFQHDHCINQGIGTSRKLFSKHPARPTSSILKSFCTEPPELINHLPVEQLDEWLVKYLLPQWINQLRAGINLACYGYGSKSKLLDELVSRLVNCRFSVYRMRAYEEEYNSGMMRLNKLLQAILIQMTQEQAVDANDEHHKSPSLTRDSKELINQLASLFENCPKITSMVVIIIEMLDAPVLRSPEIWRFLAQLVEATPVRLVFTLEHHLSPHLIPSDVQSRLGLAWHNATTLRPYERELLVLPMNFGGDRQARDEENRQQGAKFVLASLTQTGRAVFKVLAEYQLSQKLGDVSDNEEDADDKAIIDNEPITVDDDKVVIDNDNDNLDASEEDDIDGLDEVEKDNNSRGMSFMLWYQRCQDAFLVSNELAFRTQLVEFIDHELVQSYDDLGQNGNEFYIPFERDQIKKLVE